MLGNHTFERSNLFVLAMPICPSVVCSILSSSDEGMAILSPLRIRLFFKDNSCQINFTYRFVSGLLDEIITA